MGVVLYEFLVGCVPFFGDTPEELFGQVVSGAFPPPPQIAAPGLSLGPTGALGQPFPYLCQGGEQPHVWIGHLWCAQPQLDTGDTAKGKMITERNQQVMEQSGKKVPKKKRIKKETGWQV